jgi:hypothetical protein
MANSSRGLIATIAITQFAVYSRFRGVRLWFAVALASFGFLLIVFGKQSFYGVASAVRGDDFHTAFDEMTDMRRSLQAGHAPLYSVFREYEHATLSLECALANAGERVPLTYFRDFGFALTRVLPQTMTASWFARPDTISLINTRLLLGLDVASLPPGLVAHAVYALGLSGIAAGLFSFGVIAGSINALLGRLVTGCSALLPIYLQTALIFGGFVSNGDPHVYFYDLLTPCAALFLIFLVRRLRKPTVRPAAFSSREHLA